MMAVLAVLSVPLLSAPVKRARVAAKGAPDERHASDPPPEYAGVYPTARPATPDLLLTKGEDHKAEALAAFAQAVIAEDNSDADAALASYRRALELDASNTELAVKVAFMLTQRDDPSAAIQILKDNIKAAPKDPLPLVYLSQIYVKNLKKPDLALKYVEQALALDANFTAAYAALFDLLLAQHQNAKVEQLLQRAAKATSTEPRFWIALGEMFTRVHFKADGVADSPDILKQTNAIFLKAAELGKKDASILAKVGNYFIDSKQMKEAIPFYFKAIGMKKDSQDPILTEAREKLARALSDTGDRTEAIAVLEDLTKSDPLNVQALDFLGELYEMKGDHEKALENFKHGLLLDETSPQRYLRVADLQVVLKRFDDAVDTSRAARTRFPDEPSMHLLYAHSLSLAKHHDEALEAFAEAQSDFEVNGHDEALNAEFYFFYGAAAEQGGLIDKAAELLQKSIDLDPRNAAQAYNYLGYMWADRGEHLDEAEEMIKQALAQDQDKGEFLDSLGWVYFKKGDFQKAVEELQKAAENIKPEDATVYDHLGDVYLKMGNSAEAMRYWQKAIAMHQDDLDAKKVEGKIDAAKQKVTSSARVPAEQKAK